MSELPEKVVRFDVLRVERGRQKMCRCSNPHYEVDKQNRLVYCLDCGAVVDPFEALYEISVHYQRIEEWTQQNLEQRRQIDSYKPRRVVIKKLEERYVRNDKSDLIPTCPACGKPFELESLLTGTWCNRAFLENWMDE